MDLTTLAPISFSCLIALAKIANTMLSDSGDNRHTYFVPGVPGMLLMFHKKVGHMLQIPGTYCLSS